QRAEPARCRAGQARNRPRPLERMTGAIVLAVMATVPTGVADSSHPEHPEARPLNRSVQGRGEREAEHHARLRRIDDAVVPRAGRRVIGMTLLFVLFEDRGHERLLLLGGPNLALFLQRVATDGGEDVGRLLTAHYRNAGVR